MAVLKLPGIRHTVIIRIVATSIKNIEWVEKGCFFAIKQRIQITVGIKGVCTKAKFNPIRKSITIHVLTGGWVCIKEGIKTIYIFPTIRETVTIAIEIPGICTNVGFVVKITVLS